MTRLFWTLIAMFPLPLVVLLIAGPPELFERERLSAVRDVVTSLDVENVDWAHQFSGGHRVFLGQVLPAKAVMYEQFSMVFEYDTSPEHPVLVTPTGQDTTLRYHLAEACWEVPAGQLTWMQGC